MNFAAMGADEEEEGDEPAAAVARVRLILDGDAQGAGHDSATCSLPQRTFRQLFINGEFVHAEGKPHTTLHPASCEVLSSMVPEANHLNVAAALSAANTAWPEWAARTAQERAAYVAAIAQRVREGVEMLADVESADCGRSWYDARCLLLGASCEGEWWAYQAAVLDAERADTEHRRGEGLTHKPLPIPSDEELERKLTYAPIGEVMKFAAARGVGKQQGRPAYIEALKQARVERFQQAPMRFAHRQAEGLVSAREPVGVVYLTPGACCPLNDAIREMAPALIAGNAVIVRAPAEAPLSVLALSHFARESGMPPGALAIVQGDCVDALMRASPVVGYLPQPGRRRAPGILVVLDDVDVDTAVDSIMKGFLTQGGQLRTQHSRLALQRGMGNLRADEVLRALRTALNELPWLEEPIEEQQMGDRAWERGRPECLQPLVSEARRDAVRATTEQQREECKKGGGEDIRDMARLGPAALTADPQPTPEVGWFAEPQVFVNVPTSSTLWRDAPCGPLLGVRLFDSDDDAVACVNGPVFATAATVVAADADRGAAVARRLRADSVTTSDGGGAYLCEYPAVPRGGRACSWVCRKCWEDDHGLEGMYRFMETRAMDWSESRLRPHGEDSDRSDDGGVYKDYD